MYVVLSNQPCLRMLSLADKFTDAPSSEIKEKDIKTLEDLGYGDNSNGTDVTSGCINHRKYNSKAFSILPTRILVLDKLFLPTAQAPFCS